jgi:ethanolamine ammonia-lyase small subunit
MSGDHEHAAPTPGAAGAQPGTIAASAHSGGQAAAPTSVPQPAPDPFARLRALTPARIALGRCGAGLPTGALLAFQLAHARARDAVNERFDATALAAGLGDLGSVQVASRAPDRQAYLQRPDLGRRLEPADAGRLPHGRWDAAFVIADGLSAPAVQAHALPTLRAVLAQLPREWRIAPVVLASGARVALGDEIGERLGAELVAVLIGERPGLSAPDSLGVYLTWEPRVGRRDHERNCISNVRPEGLPYEEAAARLAWLMRAARQQRLTGVMLKDGSALPLPGPSPTPSA